MYPQISSYTFTYSKYHHITAYTFIYFKISMIRTWQSTLDPNESYLKPESVSKSENLTQCLVSMSPRAWYTKREVKYICFMSCKGSGEVLRADNPMIGAPIKAWSSAPIKAWWILFVVSHWRESFDWSSSNNLPQRARRRLASGADPPSFKRGQY